MNGSRYEKNYFLGLFHMSTADTNTFFASLEPPPEGGGEVLFGDGPDDPFPGVLEGLLGQGHASQLHLDLREEEEVRRGQVRQIGRVLYHPDLSGSQPILDDGGGVDRSVIPMEEPLLLDHQGPLLPQMLHEAAQGLDDVIRVDGFAPGYDVGVDEPLRVEEGQNHLLRAAGLNLGLYGARLAFFYPLFGLFFRERGVVGHRRFVHGHNVVQNGHGLPLDQLNEVLRGPHSLKLLVL